MLAGVRVGGTPYLPTTFRWACRVIDYMHDNIKSELDVNTLAEIAFMSPAEYRNAKQKIVNSMNPLLRCYQPKKRGMKKCLM